MICTLQPWQRKTYESYGIIRLHEEIIDFCNFVKPTYLERLVRNNICEKVKDILLKRWPRAEVHVFGSIATDLFLPSSDIDIVVCGEWKYQPLRTVEQLILVNNLAEEVKVIDSATVPIVKFIEKESGISVDISFNRSDGVRSIEIIKTFLSKFPLLKPLFTVVKQFMVDRDLTEVYSGGMGSYCVLLLCVSFLQHYNKKISESINLGTIVIEFFELYGRSFNFINTAISVTGKGQYVAKGQTNFDGGQRQSVLSIIDPQDKHNDIARSCFGLHNIRTAFSHAYSKLCSGVIPMCMVKNNGDSNDLFMDNSVLASIIKISPRIIKFRESIKSKFAHLVDFDNDKFNFQLPGVIIKVDLEILSDSMPKTPENNHQKKKVKRKLNKSLNTTVDSQTSQDRKKYNTRVKDHNISEQDKMNKSMAKAMRKRARKNSSNLLSDWEISISGQKTMFFHLNC